MPPRNRKRDPGNDAALTFTEVARREQITTLAIELIAEHGYAGTSLARIAAAAGISNAAVLYHFGSKAAVLENAYTVVIDGLTEFVATAMANAATARDSVEAYVRSLVGYVVSNPTHTRLIMEVLTTSDLGKAQQPPDADSPQQPRWAPLADAMTQAQEDGDYRPFEVRTYAIAVGGAIDAIFAESLTDPEYNLDQALNDLIELLKHATQSSHHDAF